jgi:competence protein ComEA
MRPTRMLCSTLLCTLLVCLAPASALAAVNANTASPDELRTVRGIGPSIAQRIVDERRRGAYASLDDLQARVRGVGESSVRKMAAGGLIVGASAGAGTSGATPVAARPRIEHIEGRARDASPAPAHRTRAPHAPHAPRTVEAAR